MPCTSLEEMIEVTLKNFGPAETETIPFPPILTNCNVLDTRALLDVFRCFDVRSNCLYHLHEKFSRFSPKEEVYYRSNVCVPSWIPIFTETTATVPIPANGSSVLKRQKLPLRCPDSKDKRSRLATIRTLLPIVSGGSNQGLAGPTQGT